MITSVGTPHRHKTKSSLWYDKTDVASGSTHTHEIPGYDQLVQDVLSLRLEVAELRRAPRFPPDTTISKPLTPTLPVPGYLSPIIDPVWGTKVTRVSQVAGVRNQYSRRAGWNADGSIIGLLDKGNPSSFLDGRTYQVQKTMQRGSEPIWSNTDPNLLYTTNGSDTLQKVAYSTGAITPLHLFADYTLLTIGDYEGTQSNDDRYFALQGRVGGVNKVIVYDALTDRIEASKDVTTLPNNCSMSQSGGWVLIQYASNGAGVQQGSWVYPRDLTGGRQVSAFAGHCDLGYSTAGDEVFVTTQDGGSGKTQMVRLADGTPTPLFPSFVAFSKGHVSTRNTRRPGWAYFSQSDAAFEAGYNGVDQIAAVKLDGSGALEVFAHAHKTVPDDPTYGWQPMATVSPDGRKVLWGSDWHAPSPNAPVYAYVAEAT